MLHRILNFATHRTTFILAGTTLAAAGLGVANKDKINALVKTGEAGGVQVQSYLIDESPSQVLPVERKWDKDWDKRDPLSLVNNYAYYEATEEKREEMLNKETPTATRNIFLIRHGQFEDSEMRQLTPLGREQAALLGKRLAESEIRQPKFDKCYISTMQRAKETAQIALKHLPYITESDKCKKETNLLEEGFPYPPEPPISNWRPKKYFYEDNARIEAAFRKYIHRASPKQKEDSYELAICHANVIRYFVCRALQFPPEGWLRINLANTSITWLQIRPNGHVSLCALGDFGHLPPEKVTFII